MESAHPALPQTWNRFAYVLNNPLVIIDPNGEGWLQLDGSDTLYWDDRVNSQRDAERLYPNRKAVYLPPGTILVVTASSIPGLRGHSILLGDARTFFDLGIKPKPFVELEWYGGNGEKFLKAYFAFVLENAVLGFVGAKAVDAVEALYHIAKARRAGKAMLQMLEAAKKAEGVCFPPGTKVTTREGDKPIEELREGDLVLSFDPDCVETLWQHVTRVFQQSATELLDITVDGVKISCTPEHPFWVEGKGWTAAKELKSGTRLCAKNGNSLLVESVGHREGLFAVYNIEVERLHSYYVSSLAILVHNQCQTGGKASEFSEYLDVTKGASVANRATNVTRTEVEQSLTESGWVQSISKDAKVSIFEKDGARYVVREGARSTGGPTVDYYKAGSRSIDLKIRLRQP
jgi:hypothetical protein